MQICCCQFPTERFIPICIWPLFFHSSFEFRCHSLHYFRFSTVSDSIETGCTRHHFNLLNEHIRIPPYNFRYSNMSELSSFKVIMWEELYVYVYAYIVLYVYICVYIFIHCTYNHIIELLCCVMISRKISGYKIATIENSFRPLVCHEVLLPACGESYIINILIVY